MSRKYDEIYDEILNCNFIFNFCISGMNTEGIYRIPGNKLQVELLQSKLQEGM